VLLAVPGGQYTNLKFQAASLGLTGDKWSQVSPRSRPLRPLLRRCACEAAAVQCVSACLRVCLPAYWLVELLTLGSICTVFPVRVGPVLQPMCVPGTWCTLG
jgi:hypothetical protein